MNAIIGQPIRRREDIRFITGRGRYTDDISLPGQTWAVYVRSPYARAKLRRVDLEAARASPGVVAVFTGADLTAGGIGPLPCGWLVKSTDGTDMKVAPRPPLAVEQVNFVGEPYAMVIGETLAAARTGSELVDADFEELEAAAVLATAMEGPQIYEGIPQNLSFHWALGDAEKTATAFAAAAHVTRLQFANNRLIPNAIEPRACVAAYDASTEDFTLYTTSQNPHLERLILTAFVGLAPEHKLRVVSPDVGGGFGSKIFVYPEETAAAWAARQIQRPVKWTADRSEAFLSDAHGRDHLTTAELALDGAGTFLGLRVKTRANLGAYLSTFGSSVPTYLYGTLLAGQYRTPAIHVEVDGVYTNTAPVDAYRGAGRPEATYVVERLVETAARELGLDPVEIRRRNFIQPDQFPYETPVALIYDTGDYGKSLDRALQLADVAGFPARRAASEAKGRKRGLGYSCYIEACGLAPSQLAIALGAGVGLYESGEVRVNPTGSVTVFTGSHSHGQGHETTFAQVVASKFGIPIEQVEVVHGDTGRMEFGLGTYGSRSLAVGGSALVRSAEKVIVKGKKIAAHLMEATPDDVDFDEGVFLVRGANRRMTFGEVALAAYVPASFPEGLEPGLSEKTFYDPKNFTFPAGSHIAEVEVDPETGVVEVAAFTAVDDFGEIINPMIVEGQVHGGLAQGIGQALLEVGVYDDDGQLLTGSFMDYAMPRADDLPNFTVDNTVTPCTHNPLGAKGCGEAGAIGSPPAIINAITDALGIADIAMPATPERVWRAANGL
ncbi:MAG TPA: xanthine dehydrogenase family protein molybdopterin-binding subunit [Caulobacteraceae bacterium]|jgi:carbon-monoxide dehydrogenase large subunit|nr:xanthine dehydrogenase family protein molybdopterin-binding subunit [Caulobacteraceae bacterium]